MVFEYPRFSEPASFAPTRYASWLRQTKSTVLVALISAVDLCMRPRQSLVPE